MPACSVLHQCCRSAFPFAWLLILLSWVGTVLVSGILTPSSGPSALTHQPPPCTRLESGWKGAVSFNMSKLYSWGTFATPHLLASNGPNHNKVRTTVSHRFHKNSESLQETATIAGDVTEVHTPVVKLPLSFLQETLTKKSLKSLKKDCQAKLRGIAVFPCSTAQGLQHICSAFQMSPAEEAARRELSSLSIITVHGTLTSTMALLWWREIPNSLAYQMYPSLPDCVNTTV